MVYNFKRIQPVPTNKQFVDIVLTRVRDTCCCGLFYERDKQSQVAVTCRNK